MLYIMCCAGPWQCISLHEMNIVKIWTYLFIPFQITCRTHTASFPDASWASWCTKVLHENIGIPTLFHLGDKKKFWYREFRI